MPKHERGHRSRRRRSSSHGSDSEPASRVVRGRSRSRDRDRRERDDRRATGDRHRRDRSGSRSRQRRDSRDRKGHRSHRDRSRSRSPHKDSSRKHGRRHSKERRRVDRDNERSRPSHQFSRRDRSAIPSRSPSPHSRRSKKPLPSQLDAFTRTPNATSETSTPAVDREKPNFANTGRLAAETNTVSVGEGTIVLKYHEPPEARKPPPKDAWRLYIFKGDDLLDTIELGGRSCWLIGREQMIADLPVEHPSCSKQHAAIQFRYVEKRNEFGDKNGRVRPYLIDLESANGSSVNGEPVPAGHYLELIDKDVIKFGLSTREYVLMLPPAD